MGVGSWFSKKNNSKSSSNCHSSTTTTKAKHQATEPHQRHKGSLRVLSLVNRRYSKPQSNDLQNNNRTTFPNRWRMIPRQLVGMLASNICSTRRRREEMGHCIDPRWNFSMVAWMAAKPIFDQRLVRIPSSIQNASLLRWNEESWCQSRIRRTKNRLPGLCHSLDWMDWTLNWTLDAGRSASFQWRPYFVRFHASLPHVRRASLASSWERLLSWVRYRSLDAAEKKYWCRENGRTRKRKM